MAGLITEPHVQENAGPISVMGIILRLAATARPEDFQPNLHQLDDGGTLDSPNCAIVSLRKPMALSICLGLAALM